MTFLKGFSKTLPISFYRIQISIAILQYYSCDVRYLEISKLTDFTLILKLTDYEYDFAICSCLIFPFSYYILMSYTIILQPLIFIILKKKSTMVYG